MAYKMSPPAPPVNWLKPAPANNLSLPRPPNSLSSPSPVMKVTAFVLVANARMVLSPIKSIARPPPAPIKMVSLPSPPRTSRETLFSRREASKVSSPLPISTTTLVTPVKLCKNPANSTSTTPSFMPLKITFSATSSVVRYKRSLASVPILSVSAPLLKLPSTGLTVGAVKAKDGDSTSNNLNVMVPVNNVFPHMYGLTADWKAKSNKLSGPPGMPGISPG